MPGESPILHCRNCGNRWGTLGEGPEHGYARRVFVKIHEASEKSGRSRTGPAAQQNRTLLRQLLGKRAPWGFRTLQQSDENIR